LKIDATVRLVSRPDRSRADDRLPTISPLWCSYPARRLPGNRQFESDKIQNPATLHSQPDRDFRPARERLPKRAAGSQVADQYGVWVTIRHEDDV
jgi:hypothetical protein